MKTFLKELSADGCEVGLLIYGDAGASLDGFVMPLLGWRRRWYSMTHLDAYVVRYDARRCL